MYSFEQLITLPLFLYINFNTITGGLSKCACRWGDSKQRKSSVFEEVRKKFAADGHCTVTLNTCKRPKGKDTVRFRKTDASLQRPANTGRADQNRQRW